jgi:hypothetical protein
LFLALKSLQAVRPACSPCFESVKLCFVTRRIKRVFQTDKFGVPYGGLGNGIGQALGLPTMADVGCNPVCDATNGNSSTSRISSWIRNVSDYLASHPVTISVNEIAAVQITYQHSTKTICSSAGLGASFPPSKAFTVGILNAGDMDKWTDVVSGPGYSFGANLFAGYQGMFNSSGKLGGPTISGVGISGSYTIGRCVRF